MGVESLRGSLSPSLLRPSPLPAIPARPPSLSGSGSPQTRPQARPGDFSQSRFEGPRPVSRAQASPLSQDAFNDRFDTGAGAVPGDLAQDAFNDRFDAGAGAGAGVQQLPDSIPVPPSRPGTDANFTVDQGQLTFDAEGQETRGPYFSHEAHHPGSTSGVTIGRGYDMKNREQADILEDLTAAGVPQEDAERLSQGAGLTGAEADKFLDEVADIEITPEAQKALFEGVYDEYAGTVERISNKEDVKEKYGETDWANLDPAIKDVLVDLCYRGDYTPKTRKEIQSLVAANDLQGLYDVLSDEDKMINDWGVPRDRFERRRDYLSDALAAQTPEQQPAG